MTERVRMSFKVKEFSNGQPWICLEPIKETLKVLVRGSLGFDLQEELLLRLQKRSLSSWERILRVCRTPGSSTPAEMSLAKAYRDYRLSRELEKMEKLEKQ